MPAYSEAELRYARPLASALLESHAFRRWWFSGTRFESWSDQLAPIGPGQAVGRSKTTKAPFWFNYWCGRDSRCRCRVGTGIETDVLLLFSGPENRRLALHVEVKRPDENLGNGQAESYARRAACWADRLTKPKTVMEHDEYLVAIVCGRNLENDRRLRLFDRVAFHDDVSKMITGYPEAHSS